MLTFVEGIVSRLGIKAGTKSSVVSYPTLKGGGKGNTKNAVDANTTYLLHMDGADNGTTFTDAKGNSWLRSDVVTSTADKVFGTASAKYPLSGTPYLYTASSSKLPCGTSDFTVDLRINLSTLADDQWMFYWLQDGSNEMRIGAFADGRIIFLVRVAGAVAALYTASAGTMTTGWKHIAVVRFGTTMYLFVNGTKINWTESTAIGSTSIPQFSGVFYVGKPQAQFAGITYIDEFRVVKGVAAWTSSFTPPTAAYT